VTEHHPDLSETARIARDLIRFDTSNWGNGVANSETEAAHYVGDYLESLGLTATYIDSEPGRTSVITRVEGANPDLPALVVHGHLDVVPVDPDHWSVDPFAGEIRDGMLWGRGAVDMKDMDAMILTALREMYDMGQKPNRTLIVAFFADEENGGKYGSHHIVTRHPELFAAPQRPSARSAAIPSRSATSARICCKRARKPSSGRPSRRTERPLTARASCRTTR